MSLLLVGSAATQTWFPEFRNPKDIDYWVCQDYPAGRADGKRIEYKNVSQYPNLLKFYYECLADGPICKPEMLLTLKISHSFWNINWKKTADDILFLQDKGIKPNLEYIKILKQDWETIHGKKRAYLNKSNDDFFRDNVNRVYQHDSLHDVMRYYDQPLYSKCKKDQSKALLSESIFNGWSHEDKIKLCREESYVTALERFLIPANFAYDPIKAYRQAIWKLCTSMCKGFFPEFIMLNLSELWYPDIDYVEKFHYNSDRLVRIENEYQRA